MQTITSKEEFVFVHMNKSHDVSERIIIEDEIKYLKELLNSLKKRLLEIKDDEVWMGLPVD